MIEIKVSDFDEPAREFINMLTNNKGKEIRNEMIKFLKENNWPDSSEYAVILEFIDDFFFSILDDEKKQK